MSTVAEIVITLLVALYLSGIRPRARRAQYEQERTAWKSGLSDIAVQGTAPECPEDRTS